jgi:phosphatidylinositol kinase/protein kinase (PI-3  family)
MTCERVLEVLRSHRDSVMAVLEAFVYDPLLNWRLMDGLLSMLFFSHVFICSCHSKQKPKKVIQRTVCYVHFALCNVCVSLVNVRMEQVS